MNFKENFTLFSLAVLIVSSPVAAFGYGLGNAESPKLQINDESYKIKTKISPEIIENQNQEFSLGVELIDASNDDLVKNVNYYLKILDEKNTILLDLNVGTNDDKLMLTMISEDKDNFSFSQEQSSGQWKTSVSNPLEITGPIFMEGGVYKIHVSVLSIDNQTISDENIFETVLIIGEILSFQIDDGESNHDLKFITYFESVNSLEFEKENNKILAEMDFDWSPEFIESIPFVHAEVYLPKSWNVFSNHEINTFVNNFQVLDVVDKSKEENIIVHFVISNKQLKNFLPKMSDENKNRILFEISTGELIEPIESSHDEMNLNSKGEDEAMIKITEKEDWKLLFWWEPMGKIMPDDDVTFNIMFHDPETDVMQKDIEYDFEIYQNDNLIESRMDSQTLSGHALQDYTFDSNGPVEIIIKNINGEDADVRFGFLVGENSEEKIAVPEWVRNNAKWWSEKQIDDSTFSSGIEFMIKEGIILVPETQKQNTEDATIPDWVRNNAKWWSDGQIGDKDFAAGLQYLIKAGVITV